MKKAKSWIGIMLVAVLIAGVFCGCEKSTGTDKTRYLGTWTCNTSSDTAEYLIFDENGYWSIFIDYRSLLNGMQQRPELFSTFEHFIDGNVYSGISKCTFKYIKDTDSQKYTEEYVIDENGNLDFIGSTGLFPYKKYSDNTGYPEEAILKEAKKIFDRALADSKK